MSIYLIRNIMILIIIKDMLIKKHKSYWHMLNFFAPGIKTEHLYAHLFYADINYQMHSVGLCHVYRGGQRVGIRLRNEASHFYCGLQNHHQNTSRAERRPLSARPSTLVVSL